MNKDFYDFLFNIRTSGFIHHTPENTEKLLYDNLHEKFLSFLGIEAMSDHDVAPLSDNKLRDMRNMVICFNSVASYITANKHVVDSEYIFTVSDYFINKSESVRSLNDFNNILHEMAYLYHQILTEKKYPNYSRHVNSCIRYIRQHLYSPIKAIDIAEYIGLSQTYITTLFKKETGYSLYDYVQQQKIEEVKSMLLHTNYSLTKISTGLGYNSLSHMSKSFKSATGMSPSEYRKKQQRSL